jgi:alkaline phosphatase
VRDKAGDAGYTIVTSLADVLSLNPGRDKVLAVHPALTHESALPYAIDAPSQTPSLADYVRAAADFLEGGKGFFIMAEGGKIDWACHDNDIASAVHEVLAFDEAVQEAKKFFDRHPRETLIVVTADHETGGLALNSNNPLPPDASLLNSQTISMEEFCFRHIITRRKETAGENPSLDELLPEIERFFGLCRLSAEQRRTLGRKASEGDRDARRRFLLSLSDSEYGELQHAFAQPRAAQIGETIVRILGAKAGFSWISDSHSAQPVPVFALGEGQENFRGFYDNTDLVVKFADLLDIRFER